MLGKLMLLAIGVQVQPGARLREPRGAGSRPPSRGRARRPSGAAAPAAAPSTAPSGAPAAVAPPPRQAMKYGYVPILAGGAMFIAQDRGYFAEQGIDLEMVSFDSGALLTPAVAAGQLEAGHGTPGPALFNVLAREITMKAVSVISWNGTVLMVRKDLADAGQIQTVQDLEGKRVSLMVEGSPIDFTMRRVLLPERAESGGPRGAAAEYARLGAGAREQRGRRGDGRRAVPGADREPRARRARARRPEPGVERTPRPSSSWVRACSTAAMPRTSPS